MRILVFLCLLSCAARGSATPKDSTRQRIHLHLSGSFYPLLDWSNSIDTNGNFMNSPARFEVQASYKKHVIGLGASFEQGRSKGSIAGTPRETIKTNFSLIPFYMYRLAATKRWSVYLGGGCMLRRRSSEYVISTSLENITDTWITSTYAPMLLSRCNYLLNKHISIELELNTYWATLINKHDLVYPLTTSLGISTKSTSFDYSYSIPGNLWFKYSF